MMKVLASLVPDNLPNHVLVTAVHVHVFGPTGSARGNDDTSLSAVYMTNMVQDER